MGNEPVFTNVLQYYMDTSDSAETPVYTNVTEDTAFDPSSDITTYDPKYKDRINQPSYVSGKKTTIEMDIDIIKNQPFQVWLLKHEDDVNVPTSVVRVWMDEETSGAYKAKMANFVMTEKPIDGPSGEALKATGTLTMTSDKWTEGTFNPTTKAFTPNVVTPPAG